MKKLTLMAGAAVMALTGAANAADYTFALVPKNVNNPFFDQARDGCKKAEGELDGKIECLYIGPGEHGGGEEQLQMVNDLVVKGVDGIAVAPSNAAAMASALQAAKDAGIPVLTWDSDLLPENADLRTAYIGTKKLRYRRQPRENRAGSEAGRRLVSASSPVVRPPPTTMSACKVFGIRSARRKRHRKPWQPSRRRQWLDRGRGLPALHGRRLPALGAAA